MVASDYMGRFWLQITIAAMVVILLGASVFIVKALPPHRIVMATGAEGGAAYETGLRYREILARAGVDLQLLQTTGAMENLVRLRDPRSGVGVGFVQGGTTTSNESPGLESLGTVFYEPLWLFSRHELGAIDIQGMRGRRIWIGSEGSGTRALALKLIERAKLAGNIGEVSGLTPQGAGEKLIAGDIDMMFIITSWDSPIVQRLIAAEGVEVNSFPRAEAWIKFFPFLTKLELPAGVGDLATNRPPTDIVMLAPKASLAVRSDLHPAIQYLLLNAATQVHSQPDVFQKAGQFPAAESIDLPLSDEAKRFYKSGRPFLQQYLPFWFATLVEWLLVVLVPILALMYPIFKFLPQIYDWIMRSRILRLYDEMRSIEHEMGIQGQVQDAAGMAKKLDHLERHASRISLPTTYASMLYSLRSHIDLVRKRLATSPVQESR
jgi:TRAP-type uncharacterized transport system substrate-binding protein